MELGTRLDLNSFVGEAVCTELGPFFTFMFLVRSILRWQYCRCRSTCDAFNMPRQFSTQGVGVWITPVNLNYSVESQGLSHFGLESVSSDWIEHEGGLLMVMRVPCLQPAALAVCLIRHGLMRALAALMVPLSLLSNQFITFRTTNSRF